MAGGAAGQWAQCLNGERHTVATELWLVTHRLSHIKPLGQPVDYVTSSAQPGKDQPPE